MADGHCLRFARRDFWEDRVMTDQVRNASELLAPEKSGRFSPKWFEENMLNPAVNAGPLGVYNTAADLVHLPTVHLKTEEAKPYSPEWFAQGFSGGLGATVPYALMACATGSLMGAADRKLAGTALGTALNPYLTSKSVATIAGAGIYGALQRPDADHTRLGNAVGSMAGLAVFTYGNGLVKDMPVMQKALTYPLIGFVGGGTMAEVSQLASNLKFAKNDVALQGAIQGATMNTVMGLGSDYLSARLQKDQAAMAEKAAESQRAASKAAIESNFDSKNVKVEQFSPKAEQAMDKLAAAEKEYREFIRDNKPKYPNPNDFDSLTQSEIGKLGFASEDIDGYDWIQAAYKKHGKGGRPPLPDAAQVASEVGKIMDKMPDAAKSGDITLGEWNMEFLTADKAKYFKDAYSQIVPKHHLMFVSETNEGGLAQVARDNGYNYVICRDNGSGQSVGFLVNPRLEVKGSTSIESVSVGNPSLRPALKVDLVDKASGEQFSAVAIHLKSMRGGEDATSSVRVEQTQALAKALGPSFKGVIAGDWNTFLDTSRDLNPLKQAGFQISNPGSSTATQSMGGRLDGFVVKNLSLTTETINPFFQNPLITRGLSDHALLTTTLPVRK
jgi:hypothetical protein